MSFYRLIVPGVRSFLVFSSLGFKPPPLAFWPILTVASRLLHPYSIDDKTSRLMVKRFSTVRDTQRGSQSYMEKRRGRQEIEVTRRRRGGIKRGEISLASNQFPMCSSQPGSLRDVQSYTEKRRGRKETGGQEDKRRNQKERDRSSQ